MQCSSQWTNLQRHTQTLIMRLTQAHNPAVMCQGMGEGFWIAILKS